MPLADMYCYACSAYHSEQIYHVIYIHVDYEYHCLVMELASCIQVRAFAYIYSTNTGYKCEKPEGEFVNVVKKEGVQVKVYVGCS